MSASRDRIIFHEYALSPYSEKVRRVFGYKKLAYASVDQPMWMPKPHLTPLTGGYRRIPVMQIGADVYCDTALIARKIEQMHPERPIVPPALEAAVNATEQWADKLLFVACVAPVFTGLASMLPPELIEDRKRMRPDLDLELLQRSVPGSLVALAAACEKLDRTLAIQPFILGEDFTLADAAVYHCLWFVRNAPQAAPVLARTARLGDWMKRLEALGSGEPTPLAATEALAIARTAEPCGAALGRGITDDASGLRVGDSAAVSSDDLPQDVFRGTVVAITAGELVIERRTEDLGRIWQHFPRVGYLAQRG